MADKVKVLSIGDPDEDDVSDFVKKVIPVAIGAKPELLTHLAKLLLGTRKAPEIVDDWESLDCFKAANIERPNKPKRYGFYCNGKDIPHVLMSARTYDAKWMFNRVKQRLSEEKWVSENVIETPFKNKPIDKEYSCDIYVQKVVSDCFDEHKEQMINYVTFLHQEHVKNK
ncbi:CG42363, partial [Drosophila busckii]